VHCASYKITLPMWDICISNLQVIKSYKNKVLMLLYLDICLKFYEEKQIINIWGKRTSEMQRLPSTLKLKASLKTYSKGVVFLLWFEGVGLFVVFDFGGKCRFFQIRNIGPFFFKLLGLFRLLDLPEKMQVLGDISPSLPSPPKTPSKQRLDLFRGFSP